MKKGQLVVTTHDIGGCGDVEVEAGSIVKLLTGRADGDGDVKVYANKDHEKRHISQWAYKKYLRTATAEEKKEWA